MHLDDKEEYEKNRDFIEHGAMFHNYEGVMKVKESRTDEYKVNAKRNEDVFFAHLKRLGADAAIEGIKSKHK